MRIVSVKKLTEKILKNKEDIILFLLLLCIGINYVYDIGSYLDIELQDETLYLRNGIFLLRKGLPSPQWAPVYSIWYFLLSAFNTDSITLYFFNFQILTLILPLLLYVFLRTKRVSQIIAFLIGFFFLISSGNISVHPKVTHFALLLIICSFLLFSLTKKNILGWSFIIIGSLLSAYVRPELFISFIFITVFFLYRVIKTKSFLINRWNILKISLIALVLIIIIGNPIGVGGRAFGAFKQHFSLNWVAWNHSALNPWRDCDIIIQDNFGNISNVPEALFSNTELFIKHLYTNVSIIFSEFSKLTSYTVFTVDNYRLEYIGLYLLLFIISILTLVDLYRSKTPILQLLKSNFNDSKCIIITSIFYLIPIFSSIIIIYPRQHYLLFLLFFVIIIFLPLIKVDLTRSILERNLTSIALVLFAILLLFVTPDPKKFYSNYSQNDIETVKFLRSLNINTKVNMLEDNGGYYTYLTPNYSWITSSEKIMDFNKFLEKYEINLIILSGKLLGNKKFNSDSTFKKFLVNYRDLGFSKYIIPNGGNELIIKNDLHYSIPK
ncbi:MAG: hypothetical protein LC124_12160 [Ignavibacteriales bacterium]|nr:hypothetical protein [Ignavibacteriales bacterium]